MRNTCPLAAQAHLQHSSPKVLHADLVARLQAHSVREWAPASCDVSADVGALKAGRNDAHKLGR